MERETFDRIARLIGSAGTRRDALRRAIGAAVLGGAAMGDGVSAKRRRKSKNRRVSAQQAVVPCPGPPTLRDCSNKPLGPGVNLSRCDLIDKEFFSVTLQGANLSGASFFLSDLFGPANLRGANASNVCFGQASLTFADFRSANVRGANFCGADLRGADFRSSNITAEQLACATVGCDTILPNGKPAVVCDADQVCCGAACCAPEQCENDTCIIPPLS